MVYICNDVCCSAQRKLSDSLSSDDDFFFEEEGDVDTAAVDHYDSLVSENCYILYLLPYLNLKYLKMDVVVFILLLSSIVYFSSLPALFSNPPH